MTLRWKRCGLAAMAVAFAAVGAAPAQDMPPSPATLVEEVQVIGRLPGPALWRVSTTTSQLWILGVAGPLPRGFKWNDQRVAKALEGSSELVLPPGASAGLLDVMGLLLDTDHVIHMPAGQTIRDGMSPDLRARWEAAARGAGQDPAHYDHWRPVLAAGALTGDAARHDGLNPGGPLFQVAVLAKKMHVKVRPLANYRAVDLIKAIARTPDEASQVCLAMAADAAATMKDDAPKLAEAWAKGDLATVKARNDRAAECTDKVPAVTALKDRAAADWAKELKTAISQPGKVMVAADLDTLTRQGGLLDQLNAQGLEVIGPNY
jgi:uncharacterized protein YbaP (TraB family)